MCSPTENHSESEDGIGFVRVGIVLGDVMKEIRRRVELRERVEVEGERPVSDQEFLVIAEQTGLTI